MNDANTDASADAYRSSDGYASGDDDYAAEIAALPRNATPPPLEDESQDLEALSEQMATARITDDVATTALDRAIDAPLRLCDYYDRTLDAALVGISRRPLSEDECERGGEAARPRYARDRGERCAHCGTLCYDSPWNVRTVLSGASYVPEDSCGDVVLRIASTLACCSRALCIGACCSPECLRAFARSSAPVSPRLLEWICAALEQQTGRRVACAEPAHKLRSNGGSFEGRAELLAAARALLTEQERAFAADEDARYLEPRQDSSGDGSANDSDEHSSDEESVKNKRSRA